jgi:hypothetical protein
MTDQPITQQQLDLLEKAADKVFGKLGIDIEFTRHFLDRVNDERNKKQITLGELGAILVKEYKRWGKRISGMPISSQAVMHDLSSELNIPFVLKKDGDEKDLVAKTIMRKKNFTTPDPKLTVEDKHGAKKGSQVKGSEKTPSKRKPTTGGETPHPMRGRLVGEARGPKIHTTEQIADRHDVHISMIEHQLREGMLTELANTDSMQSAMEATLTHLHEMPDYYSRLADRDHKLVEMVQRGAWEATQLRSSINERIMDPREAMLRKALEYLDKMIADDGGQDKQTIGGAAFDIARAFNIKDMITPRELAQLYMDWKKTDEGITEVAGPEDCWDGYKKDGTQAGTGKNSGKRVNNCVKEEEVTLEESDDFHEQFGYLGYSLDEDEMFEAEYQGRKVKLNKPMQGDVKKFKVYVKDGDKVKKVNFGHGGTSVKGTAMRIKKDNPAARKSFRARHNCDNPGPKTKARYWSCRKW